MSPQEWISLNRLDAQISSNICSIENEKYLIVERGNDEILFDEDFQLTLSAHEQQILLPGDIHKVLFEFGNNWYWSHLEEIQLNVFKYIGKETPSLEFDFPYLGIHGEYDLCNGSRQYSDWCKKAKFLNTSILGICETNTLAGTLAFQEACQKAKIKSIIGETVTVKRDDKLQSTYQVKLYCKNGIGWKNLLNINAQIKVFNNGFVEEDYLWSRSEGLICVLMLGLSFQQGDIDLYNEAFGEDIYFQLDFVEWQATGKENEYLQQLKTFTEKHINEFPTVLINDSYYLDKSDAHIKKHLNSIGKVSHQNQSIDQYYKSLQDILNQIEEVSPDDKWTQKIFDSALANTVELAEKCNFQIQTGEFHLPQYEMTEYEKEQCDINEDLFLALIFKGFEEKKELFVKDEEEYLQRIEKEVDLIKRGGFIDYFLITADILNWCRINDILCPMGRGSAAGSLVSYLLEITQLDPIKYNLLFERFLSEARILQTMPDIDNDLPSDKRESVKRYMEERYGLDYITSVGTYGTFKIRSGITDLSREFRVDLKTVKYITAIIPEEASLTDLFKIAAVSKEGKDNVVKNFVQANSKVIENFPLLSGQVKNASIHAAGVIIVPKTYKGQPMTVYDWMPVKRVDGVLVSEWEGTQLEKAGFSKIDILGVKQLEKIANIIHLIKEHHGEKITFKNIPLDDEKVYELFQEGYNEDIFQLGGPGLKGYCKKLKPEGIEDLIATLALYRPGPMESGAHEDYIKIKNGHKHPEYDYMLEEVTKGTHSKYVYQEQIMQAVQILGNLTLAESEEVRSAMGKKVADKMELYRTKFLKGAIDNGCDQYDAIRIWNKLEVFAGYAFNRSHSACYAHIGYYCQWLKVNYSLEFWSITLNASSQDELPKRIAEMHTVSNIKVLPPDINQSTNTFTANQETQEIFWSINSIAFVGDIALGVIMKEREEKGKFYSFDDFFERVPKTKVNKKVVTNLIVSGCFDKIENIQKPAERLNLLKSFLVKKDEDLPEDLANTDNNWKDYFWILKQKELTGFGYLEFDHIYDSYLKNKLKNPTKLRYVDSLHFQDDSVVGRDKVICGILKEIVQRNSIKGQFAQVTINCNDQNIVCLIWSETWAEIKETIIRSVNKIICITGEIKFDGKYKNENILQSNLNSQILLL